MTPLGDNRLSQALVKLQWPTKHNQLFSSSNDGHLNGDNSLGRCDSKLEQQLGQVEEPKVLSVPNVETT